MGKRKRRLLSPKFARKFAHLRKTVTAAVADGVVTKEEAEKIEAAVEEVVEKVKPVDEPKPTPKAAAKPAVKKATPKTKSKK